MIKHKKLIVTVVAMVIVISVVAVVLAYFTDKSEANNSITIGKNEIEVSEDFVPPTEQTTDTKYKKKVSVTNTGNIACYVRVYADFSDEQIRNNSYFSNDNDIDTATFYPAVRDTDNDKAYVSNLPNGWIFVPDDSPKTKLAGYYYYTKPIKPNETTATSLFTYIETKYENLNDVKQYDVIVYSESVQTTDSNGSPYADYEAAWDDFLK